MRPNPCAGELSPALAFSWAHWQVVPLCCAAALAGYLAVMCVLAIIQHHGATVAECVKSMRKVLQVRTSWQPCEATTRR